MLTVGVITLHVALEEVSQGLFMKRVEVVRLSEGIYCELPIAFNLISVPAEPAESPEIPGIKLFT